MKITGQTLETMKKQIYLDCNVYDAEEISKGIFLSPSKILEGSRIINKMDPFFRVVILMGNAYIMADESILGGCNELFKDSKPEWFFDFDNLRRIDYILHEYKKEIVNTHIYFLPAEGSQIEEPWGDEIWLNEKDIENMRENNICHRALCYSPTQPDVIAVMLKDGEKIKGMAGASLDGKYVHQIGIDVKEGYEGRGIAVHLVKLLKQRLLEQGTLPFYGTCESHAVSQSVAVRSGFMPAFSEFFVSETKDNIKNN
ncbi:MAG: GNAT family N-acetyltransferase [Lachnospiraceae bacterium]|nr:GNAT family N-acetyltransferase [Lachnospiraceae bacterium]